MTALKKQTSDKTHWREICKSRLLAYSSKAGKLGNRRASRVKFRPICKRCATHKLHNLAVLSPWYLQIRLAIIMRSRNPGRRSATNYRGRAYLTSSIKIKTRVYMRLNQRIISLIRYSQDRFLCSRVTNRHMTWSMTALWTTPVISKTSKLNGAWLTWSRWKFSFKTALRLYSRPTAIASRIRLRWIIRFHNLHSSVASQI